MGTATAATAGPLGAPPVWLYSNLCLDKCMQALEQLQQAQPWVVLLEEEEEEPEEGPSREDGARRMLNEIPGQNE